MSDTSTNVLTSFQATTSKGGDLLGDAVLSGGDTDQESGVTFSNVLNQARSTQADSLTEETTQLADGTTRHARVAENNEPVRHGEATPVDNRVDSRTEPSRIDGREPEPRKDVRTVAGQEADSANVRTAHVAVEGTGSDTELTKPVVSVDQAIDAGESVEEHGQAVLREVAPAQVNPSPGQTLQSEVTASEAASVVSANRVTDTETGTNQVIAGSGLQTEQIENVSAVQADDLSGEGIKEIDTGDTLAVLNPTKSVEPGAADLEIEGVSTLANEPQVAATVVPVASVSQGSKTSEVEQLQQPVVSAAAVANRLNVQSPGSVAQTSTPIVVNEVPATTGTETERLTTIAGIQSVQAGISGMVQPSNAQASTTSTSPVSITGPVTDAPSTLTNGGAIPAEQINKAPVNTATPTVNNAVPTASNIQSETAEEIPANANLLNGQIKTATENSPARASVAGTTPVQLAMNDSSPTVTINPLLDNMLSAPASGIVTAPILARTDLTGAPLVQTPLNVPLLSPEASDAMAGNVKWMVGEGIQNAVVNVSPNGMGPISVQIGIEKEQMSISIVASQSSTREALESMLPRLRDQMSSQGMETIRVDISDGRGDRTGNFSGFERQNMGYTTADSNQNSQQRNSDTDNNQAESTEMKESEVNGSGERELSDTERALVDQLKNSSTNSSVKNVSISHGYDLYV